MKTLLAFFCLSLSSFVYAVKDLFYLGTWQSNAERTIASMAKVPSIPTEAKELMSTDFFGKLVIVIKKDSFATYSVGEKPDKLKFYPHNVKILSGNSVSTTYYDEITDSSITNIITFEGNCYSMSVTKWAFKEYFCRVE